MFKKIRQIKKYLPLYLFLSFAALFFAGLLMAGNFWLEYRGMPRIVLNELSGLLRLRRQPAAQAAEQHPGEQYEGVCELEHDRARRRGNVDFDEHGDDEYDRRHHADDYDIVNVENKFADYLCGSILFGLGHDDSLFPCGRPRPPRLKCHKLSYPSREWRSVSQERSRSSRMPALGSVP